MWINEISIFWQCVFVFSSQLIFVFSRTLNVIYTAEHHIIGSILTGVVVNLSWLVSVTLGINSVVHIDTNYWVIITFVIAGIVGTHEGIRIKKWLKR